MLLTILYKFNGQVNIMTKLNTTDPVTCYTEYAVAPAYKIQFFKFNASIL
jgi:hypothetical protein